MKLQFLHLVPVADSFGSNVTLGPRITCLDVEVGARAAADILGLPAVAYSRKSGALAPLSSYIALPGYALDISRGNGRAFVTPCAV